MSPPGAQLLLSVVERRLTNLAQPSDERPSSPGPCGDLVWDPKDSGSVQCG
jgi:hypothetical protein